ncbi:hypothetical protein NBH81_07125 [Aeromonas veronii]|uniref:hypothetical protein n=1 Tax=Aeromonas veronii TaxID=654 RepID=UPI0021DA9435|nr:hypothetical protein [Aeromonas veronii]UYB72238.1 hypothetical protein NBH81_07125 [Aeromonas veronii]
MLGESEFEFQAVDFNAFKRLAVYVRGTIDGTGDKTTLLKRHIQNIPLPYNLNKMRVQVPWHLTHIEVLVKPAADGYLPKASSLVLGFPSLLYVDNQCHGRILKASQ